MAGERETVMLHSEPIIQIDDPTLCDKTHCYISQKQAFKFSIHRDNKNYGAARRSSITIIEGSRNFASLLRGAVDSFSVGEYIALLATLIAKHDYEVQIVNSEDPFVVLAYPKDQE